MDYETATYGLERSATGISESAEPRMVDPTDSLDWEFLEVDDEQAARLRARGEVVIDHPGLSANGATRTLIWCRDARVALERFFGGSAAA